MHVTSGELDKHMKFVWTLRVPSCVLCSNRDSGDLPLCLVVGGIDRSSFARFLPVNGER